MAALTIVLSVATAARSQQLLVLNDGSPIGCQVLGAANGQIKFTLDPSSGKSTFKPCSEVIAFIDEALIVHTDPCDAATKPKAEPTKRNCASLVRRDNTVVKGDVTSYMDDYIKIRTLTADMNVPVSDIVGQLTESEEISFTNADYAKKLMSDPVIVRMINDASQCPASGPVAKVGYSPKRSKSNFDAGKKKAALARAAAAKDQPVITYKDTVDRGLLEELDFDTFKTIALAKVKRLESYIIQLSDKKMALTMRDKVVGQALSLFEKPEENTVQTSRLMPDGRTSLTLKKIAEYLRTSLRFNKYENVKIKWADLNFASDFELQPDGSYQAVISVQQQFTGYVDGQETYSDVTNKNITVTIRSYEKFTDGGFKKLWDVFLGDIGVSSTQPG